jgi:hypothetical protein
MSLYLGRQPVQTVSSPVEGEQLIIDGEDFYCIRNYDRMRPFFMSIVSASDHWMFISSNGALTAGRQNPDLALFPYYTDDKIHDSADITGSKTVIIARVRGRDFLWQPFSDGHRGIYRVERNLHKSLYGNKLIFEEHNADLGLTFRYGWFNSERFGFIRKAWLKNDGNQEVHANILDGVQNLLPAGLSSQLQLEKSTLVDAYKKNELLVESGVALFTLSSIPIDRPEPAESLRATTVWSAGLTSSRKILSSVQVASFADGGEISQETDVRAERGAYFLQSKLGLRRGETKTWIMAAEVNQGPTEIGELNTLLRKPFSLARLVDDDIARGTHDLKQLVARADGLQKTATPLRDARHFNNVLFNIMRGGVFLDATVDKEKPLDYLPLTFSRRHGDPSRPWNRFLIARQTINYEGNWRDIFQNWEALAISFPGYTANMIAKFANASTQDGYNPYRVTRDGFDWEVVDPHDPWSHIGYWGDHQLIYLLKLLEILQRHDPATLRRFLTTRLFSYANVPYRIAPYPQLLDHPKETVRFDHELDRKLRERVRKRGEEGKLVWDKYEKVWQVNLTEKMLVAILAKLSNFIPEAGLWLNTQRPEWNDANNALVGFGASVVTLQHLRRYLAFALEIFRQLEVGEVELSKEVAKSMQAVSGILEKHRSLLSGAINDRQRKDILDELGNQGTLYREKVYNRGLAIVVTAISATAITQFLTRALEWVDHSIQANRREDGLFHSYNLVVFGADQIGIRRLYEMLEGQVAALSSGNLSADTSLRVLRALRQSALYRPDQHSFLLYPDRQLPRFTEKNIIPSHEIACSKLLRQLIADKDRTLVEGDADGQFHFNGTMTNAGAVAAALDRLAATYGPLVERDRRRVMEIYERLFDHQSFTGRSGTFFGYEGLGCIYWHMVSKLLLATQEIYQCASEPHRQELVKCYYDIRAGLGDSKSPLEYGGFPMDPYSHTPSHAGARQPGLTGQVKEDILCQWSELGVAVRAEKIHFQPDLLRREEFLSRATLWDFFDVSGQKQQLRLKKGSLGFTYCQTPIIYQVARRSGIVVHRKSGFVKQTNLNLDAATSRAIFERTGEVLRIEVFLLIS